MTSARSPDPLDPIALARLAEELRTSALALGQSLKIAGIAPVEPLAAARAVLIARRARANLFPAKWFGEAAWDIVLDLYVASAQHRSCSVSAACAAANVAPTTALRWLTILEQDRWIVRSLDKWDRRRWNIALAEDRISIVAAWLASPEQLRAAI